MAQLWYYPNPSNLSDHAITVCQQSTDGAGFTALKIDALDDGNRYIMAGWYQCEGQTVGFHSSTPPPPANVPVAKILPAVGSSVNSLMLLAALAAGTLTAVISARITRRT